MPHTFMSRLGHNPSARSFLRPVPLAIGLLVAGHGGSDVQAQSPAAPAAAAAPVGAASAPSPAPVMLAPVEVRATRSSADTEERRESTAAKIVVGRDEIERFGDNTVGDLLKRLPGVTVQGAPGRGGAIRMRGLGNGYTQILIDGDRVPPGFSIESLSPEQIERIEILRAPTAETGARAIAGTINLVMREGVRQRLNQVRAGVSVENGRLQPNVSWTRNDKLDALTYNLSLSAYASERVYENRTTTVTTPLAGGPPTEVDVETERLLGRRAGLHATGRLQGRGGKGDSWVLTPIVVISEGTSRQSSTLARSPGSVTPAPFASSEGRSEGGYSLLRLNGQYNRTLADAGKLELRGGVGHGRWDSRVRRSFDAASVPPRDDREDNRDDSANLGTKYTVLMANDHLFVAGAEFEANRRNERQDRSNEGLFDSTARSSRVAGYAQDEWTLTPQWAVHGGLRWEGIVTRGEDGRAGAVRNRSSVWSPLLHAVWKPEPKSRDQVRMSLTRSYRSPPLQSLITQPRLSTDARPNSETNPDRIGNPALRPELATGLDVAVERYLPGSGLLSANVFHRRITDYMRRGEPTRVAATEPWTSRMENVGDATTQGLEFEAKFRASDVLSEAPRVDVRLNLSVFRSRVHQVPGPDNRLDQQPGHTFNLGADYRVPATPLTLGGNLNWTPGYDTRVSESSWVLQSKKRVGEVYGLWSFNPDLQLRVTATNVAPRDYETGTRFDSATQGTSSTAQTAYAGHVNWQLRLEMKL